MSSCTGGWEQKAGQSWAVMDRGKGWNKDMWSKDRPCKGRDCRAGIRGAMEQWTLLMWKLLRD